MLAAVRNFVISFLIAAAVFGTIAWFITGFIADNVIGIAESPADTGADSGVVVSPGDTLPPNSTNTPSYPTYPDLGGESFSVLLIGTDYRPDDFNDYIENFTNNTYAHGTLGLLQKPVRTQNADFMMLVSVYESTRQITLTLIPANTRVQINNTYYLLNSRYDKGGIGEIVDFVSYLTAVQIDYYIKVNVTDAGNILDIIDGVTMNVPTDIINPYYNPDRTEENAPYSGITGDRDFETVTAIEAGERLIDSSNLFALLHYRTKNVTEGEREAVLVDLARQTLSKAVSSNYIGRAAELFTRAIKYTETNMSVSDMTANLDLFVHYDEFTVTTLSYPGTYSMLGSEECFIPNRTDAYSMFRALRSSQG